MESVHQLQYFLHLAPLAFQIIQDKNDLAHNYHKDSAKNKHWYLTHCSFEELLISMFSVSATESTYHLQKHDKENMKMPDFTEPLHSFTKKQHLHIYIYIIYIYIIYIYIYIYTLYIYTLYIYIYE